MSKQIQRKTLKEIQALLLSGDLTVVRLVENYLAQANAIKSHNAYIEIFDKEILAKAAILDGKIQKLISTKKGKLGALFGAVVSIKDNMCYEGHLSTAGSKMLDGYLSPYSSTVVKRLLEQDALIIGRTNCDEFSMGSTNETSYYGPAKNAIDPSRVPGGSSGGGAVAVALDTCLMSLGSDTGGSIRQPAAFNGVIGYKPSYGAISRWGLIAYGSSFDVIGLLGHNIDDMQTVMEAIGGPDHYDSTALPEPLSYAAIPKSPKLCTIAFPYKMIESEEVDPDVRTRTLAHIEKLKEAGYTIKDVDLDFADYLVPCYYILATAEASSNLSRFDGVRYGHRTQEPTGDYKALMKKSRTEGFGKEVKKRIMLGAYVLSEGYYDAYFTKAQKVRAFIKQKIESILKEHDYLMMPTSATAPWPLNHVHEDPLQLYRSDMYTVMANLCGIPAISYPLHAENSGLPVGVQLMSLSGADGELLSQVGELSGIGVGL